MTWYRDGAALRWIVVRYLPWMLSLNLAWETAHVRLYTLWHEADVAYIAFAVVHCTLGDLLIGGCALVLSLILLREGTIARWRWSRIAALTATLGSAYTIFSEWMNLTVLQSWTYADAMPTLDLGGFELGASPLLQWFVLPPLSLMLARRAVQQADQHNQDGGQQPDHEHPSQQPESHHPSHH